MTRTSDAFVHTGCRVHSASTARRSLRFSSPTTSLESKSAPSSASSARLQYGSMGRGINPSAWRTAGWYARFPSYLGAFNLVSTGVMKRNADLMFSASGRAARR